MLQAKDIGGLMAMMPAFATDDANSIAARNTVDVGRLRTGLDRMIRDGANVISTTGSFGECHTLLPDEFETLMRASVEVTAERVPLFIGITSPNAREAAERMRLVSQTKANGVLVGIPYYFPSTVTNAIRFIRDLAAAFPKLNMMIYHNPTLHNVTLPIEAFEELRKIPQVIGMKDSHRDALTFMKIQEAAKGAISVFCAQGQYYPMAELGAAGLWSIDAWMGPWPLLALRDAVARGDMKAAKDIVLDITPQGTRKVDLSWRETASKLAVRFAGYVDPGPMRAPFLEVPPEVTQTQKRRAERWATLCDKYRPAYQSKVA
jgi:dihydrodipicolinate synthase/N-acetylneuraminate lyase